ncbi:MAG: hypothetical protein KKB66_04660 [Alphaproteobacteria bacterium]|nr:hypothetical protein [Alphaproteobacteria bacterium]MBU0803240.1 hypothetical protein [Alphaproteobacteria bacterium]MBU0873928.1 hypothetical protein [Alphaproteobacteria bacterium]MBU1400572.1 hypothetical protein [Alphaproteobacteria bacterium]MBU1590445.1 hypothetical protein [Alphaproteobacteria bacterium]
MSNDVIVFGVGHSGTSLLTKMLHTLGWKANDADESFVESEGLRAINRDIIANGYSPDHSESQIKFIASLGRPFALKDPRLVETLPHWIASFEAAGLQPTLLMIERDRDALAQSYLDRKEMVGTQPGTRQKTLSELIELASRAFARWPHSKMVIQYENLVQAALLVKENRSMRRSGGLWLDDQSQIASSEVS